jgi:carbonic anhydrase
MASATYEEVISANNHYTSDFGEKAKLALPPARHFAILTCMDARLDPAKYAGLAEGDAHVIRNAGGRASDDAIHKTQDNARDASHLQELYRRIIECPGCERVS